MYSVIKRGERWYVKWKNGSGGWVRKACSATTKAGAEAFALELAAEADRQRRGLVPRHDTCTTTLAQLCEWWLRERCRAASLERERYRMEKHVIKHAIGAKRLPELTPAMLDARMRELEQAGCWSPATANKFRAMIHAVFEAAIEAEMWGGANPASKVRTRRVPQRSYETLRFDEVAAVLEAAGEQWRDLIATALYLGLRKGELFALRKTDILLDERTLFVRRSHDSDTVKGRKARALPLPVPLVPYLERAMKRSGSDLVFPRDDGSQRPAGTAMEKVLRRILSRAGLITGYRHICRKCVANGSAAPTHHSDNERRRCPKCNTQMWASEIPRAMRFHDLRHTTATLLLRKLVPMHLVQRILRHSNVRLTVDTYGHLEVDDLRGVMESALAGMVPEIEPELEADRLGPPVVQDGDLSKKKGPDPFAITAGSGPIFGAEHRVRTGDLRLGKATLYQLS